MDFHTIAQAQALVLILGILVDELEGGKIILEKHVRANTFSYIQAPVFWGYSKPSMPNFDIFNYSPTTGSLSFLPTTYKICQLLKQSQPCQILHPPTCPNSPP